MVMKLIKLVFLFGLILYCCKRSTQLKEQFNYLSSKILTLFVTPPAEIPVEPPKIHVICYTILKWICLLGLGCAMFPWLGKLTYYLCGKILILYNITQLREFDKQHRTSKTNIDQIKKWHILNLLDPEFVIQVRMALVFGKLGDQAIVVTRNDKVYAFGNNKTGCLGTGVRTTTFLPIEVEALSGKRVIKFVNGDWFNSSNGPSYRPYVLALTKTGKVYHWGPNGETPMKMGYELSDMKAIDILCCAHHAVVLTDKGVVLRWRLIPDTIDTRSISYTSFEPTIRLSYPWSDQKIFSIVSDMNSIYPITETGSVHQWRCPSDYELGPSEGFVGVIVKLASGYDHTMALSKDGSLQIRGRNEFGQLGNGSTKGNFYKVPLQVMGHIVDIAAGKYISAAINKRTQIYMWGLCCRQKILIPTAVPLSNIHDVIPYFSPSNVMRESQEFNQEREKSLSECLMQAFNEQSTHDFIINVRGRPIYVHKAILGLRCARFKEPKQIINFGKNQYSYEVCKAFMKYLYTGNVELSSDRKSELEELARQYLDDDEWDEFQSIFQSTSNVYELKKYPILNLLDWEIMKQVRTALVFGKEMNEAIVITRDDKVYGLGSNENGCLGIGIKTNTIYATEIEVLSGEGVIKLAVGGINEFYHVLALTRTGKVYLWGGNIFGQGNNELTDNQWIPIQITHELFVDTEVIDIACGSSTCLMLTNEGKVYQLGPSADDSSAMYSLIHKRSELFNNEKVKSIVGTRYINIALTESGLIYGWDKHHDSNTSEIEGERVRIISKLQGFRETEIVKIVAGSDHILALSKENSLHTWGWNLMGEIGCGNISDSWISYKMPRWVMGPVIDIMAASHTSAAVNQNGEVFMWGQCLGQVISIPTRTELSKLSDVLLYFGTSPTIYQQFELPKVNKIEQGFNDSTTGDLVIKVQNESIYVHKIILKIRSSYCERMLRKEWARKNTIIIRNQYSYEIYKSFFQYLYTDRVDVSSTKLNELMDLAIEFSDTRLMNLCANRIEKNERYKRQNFLTYHDFTFNYINIDTMERIPLRLTM